MYQTDCLPYANIIGLKDAEVLTCIEIAYSGRVWDLNPCALDTSRILVETLWCLYHWCKSLIIPEVAAFVCKLSSSPSESILTRSRAIRHFKEIIRPTRSLERVDPERVYITEVHAQPNPRACYIDWFHFYSKKHQADGFCFANWALLQAIGKVGRCLLGSSNGRETNSWRKLPFWHHYSVQE